MRLLVLIDEPLVHDLVGSGRADIPPLNRSLEVWLATAAKLQLF
jgi:hypothetical protein